MKNKTFWLFLILAVASGVIIGWIDTRPNWDDTAITVFLIFFSSAIIGGGFPKRAWLWAIIIGGSVISFNFFIQNNFQAMAALIISFLGSYIGVSIRNIFVAKATK